ncbi:hypothetical protein WUBG_13690 [Wuchereria bancrofti]|uniref:Uncharacterized protein n=1 Tax=Wuchereria bancrofti TaxID=6293 RepID=J9EEE8_WUCBA|nr:hypothetical protein WUBG_13690 [Wuchereria bancrofti]
MRFKECSHEMRPRVDGEERSDPGHTEEGKGQEKRKKEKEEEEEKEKKKE